MAAALLVALCWTLPAADATANWPTFRGADRTAVSPDKDLLESWPADGPPLVWQSQGAGRGYASLAIVGPWILTLGDAPSTAEDKSEYLSAFDRSTGEPRWKLKTGSAWTSGSPDWQSSRSTPTIAGDLCYVLTPSGALICAQLATGEEQWRKDLKQDFQGQKGDGWGYSESVLVDGNLVVCTPGGKKNTLVALDKQSGELVWSASWPDDRGAAHASIVVSQIGPTKVYVQLTAGGLIGVRATDGQLLWNYPIDRTTAVAPTPIVRDDLVFFTAGYGRGGALVRQVPGGDGLVSVEEVYPINRALANRHGGVVLVGDYLFGDSDDSGIPFCAELLTGTVRWKARGSGRGSVNVAAADGHLYLHWANGTMALVKAVPDGLQEVSSFKVPGSGQRPSWAHPVILDGKLYLREQDHLLCYNIREGGK